VSAATVLTFTATALGVAGCADLLGLGTGPERPRSAGAGRGLGGGGALVGTGRDASGGPGILWLLARLGRRLRPAGVSVPGDLEARIVAAGRPGGLGAREAWAAKLAAAVAGGCLAALFATGAPGRLGVALVTLGPVAGFIAPDLWLARRAADRARRARRELPALLDLLRVGVEAGGSLPKALEEVGARARGPLAAEWRALGREVALGIPLGAALRGTAERLPLPEVRSLVAALERARRHGVPLADTLAAQARDARFALARHAREEAARAGPKIQLVVALLLVPSVLLLVAAALVAALLDGGGTALPV
jgi:tight adherence protein C